jgi:lipopolysaccharide transport system ATP-binding protein
VRTDVESSPAFVDRPRGEALRAEHLSKVYRLYQDPRDRLKELMLGRFGRRYSREFWALHDVSFTLQRGDRLGLIGLNGSGKSTLLQMLAGTLAPTSGRVDVAGRVAALLELGSGFNPDYTGRENIYFNAAIHGLSREETDRRFDAIAAFADIGDFLDQPVKTYSSGMFMRVAFAVATSIDADVLLIDEALAVGDVFFTQKCYRHLHQQIERGVAIVLVSHDMNAISQFCSSVLVLDRGRLAFAGDPTSAIRTYFALSRAGIQPELPAPSPAPMAAPADAVEPDDWPGPEAWLPLDAAPVVGDGGRCIGAAICDASGAPTRTFEMGQDALFYAEFELTRAAAVPIGGVELMNERHIVVHGKNSLQHGVVPASSVPAGARVRLRQRIRLDIAEGHYSFALGLATIREQDARAVETAGYSMLAESITTLLVVPQAGTFSVRQRSQGQALPHHGLCNLEGDARVSILPARERG